jgi:hypothetical protein
MCLQAGTGIAELIALEISRQVTCHMFQNLNVGKPVSVLPVLTANAYWFDLFIDKSSD